MKQLLVALGMVLLLTGCETYKGMQKDVSKVFPPRGSETAQEAAANQDTDEDTRAETVEAVPVDCPPIEVVEDLSRIVDSNNYNDGDEAAHNSRLSVNRANASCAIMGRQLDMQMTVEFTGRRHADTTAAANFSYPYFIAVTDDAGTVLAKEIFAVSVSYPAGVDNIETLETINQKMPLAADGTIPDYNVMVGFQLNADQLAYNRRF